MSSNTILIIAITGGLLVLLFLMKYAVMGKKDTNDIDKLAKGEIPADSTGESFVDRMGRMMGIKNFKFICDEAEKMIKAGEKEAAVNYIVQAAGIERTKAEDIAEMFEKKYKK
jgi:hypothetical protein